MPPHIAFPVLAIVGALIIFMLVTGIAPQRGSRRDCGRRKAYRQVALALTYDDFGNWLSSGRKEAISRRWRCKRLNPLEGFTNRDYCYSQLSTERAHRGSMMSRIATHKYALGQASILSAIYDCQYWELLVRGIIQLCRGDS
ncbi:hypothetical protein [Sinorhizobium meliloti]|uniref:hypothetical protein n=1 Tax=Rhizobium meliloti TaxID=382 RepID=UPI000FD95D8E|nr:hypothetical protein [Sinorhizobium meliloti]RVP20765.1 hypothetical protein CN080_21035 [Sinorhizobium meliloti]